MVVAKPFRFAAEPSPKAHADKPLSSTQTPAIGPRLYVDSTNVAGTGAGAGAGAGSGVGTSSSGLHGQGQGLGEGNTSGGEGDGPCSVGYTAVMSATLQVTPLLLSLSISTPPLTPNIYRSSPNIYPSSHS